jgi:hypothetical protein
VPRKREIAARLESVVGDGLAHDRRGVVGGNGLPLHRKRERKQSTS